MTSAEPDGIQAPPWTSELREGRIQSLLGYIRRRGGLTMVTMPECEGGSITVIPPLASPTARELKVSVIQEGRSYVRTAFDDETGEHLYEVIEPTLSEEDSAALDVLKEALIVSLNSPKRPEPEYRRDVLDKAVQLLVKRLGLSISHTSRERILYHLCRDLIGHGVIDVMMADPEIEDISCVGTGIPLHVYHRGYGSMRTNVVIRDEGELDRYVIWLAQKCGKHISVARPMLDATLPGGSRLNATLGRQVTKRGSSFTIRRFRGDPLTPIDLIRFGTLDVEMMAYLWLSVEFGSSMVACGGTASGKTTTLNAVLMFIPPQMKIVSIEDTRELNLPHDNWVPGLTREGPDSQGDSDIDMFDLVTAALRQRPQYLIVGEVRGKEAHAMFQAMATGHVSYSTFHAEDVRSLVHRLENEPIGLPRSLLSSLDLVLLQSQVKVSDRMTRRVKGLTEFVGIDSLTGELITNSVFRWDPTKDSFIYSGHSYLYEKIRAIHNWGMREMEEEVRRRMEILEHMREVGVGDHRQVAAIVSAYYRDPEKTIEEVRSSHRDR